MFIFEKIDIVLVRCARVEAAQPVQIALAVYCAVKITIPNNCLVLLVFINK
jgi:hypothetical protein